MFFQGAIRDKALAKRCPYCKKYQQSNSDYRKHIEICEKKPVDKVVKKRD